MPLKPTPSGLSRPSSQPGGDKNVVDKLAADLGAKDPTFTAARIRFELEHFAEQAKRQLMKE